MRVSLRWIGTAWIACLALLAQTASAQFGCEGTTGSATIGGTPWSTQCVVAATTSDCVDSLGNNYECFQIIGSDSTGTYSGVAIFLAQAPVQGQTYSIGGASGNGAMVIGDFGLWVTGEDPYTGETHITTYNPGNGTIACTFSFLARGIFLGGDLAVTNGMFEGRLVGVAPKTWTDVKRLYQR